MANIDVTAFLEHCGIRKARFGGYEPEDVRLAMEAFGAEYEDRMARVEEQGRTLKNANAALEKHCQALAAQTRLLTDQNVALASSNEKFSRQARELSAQAALLKEKNRSLSDQNATYLLRNGDLTKTNQKLKARTDAAEQELAEKGALLDAEKTELENRRAELIGEARTQADRILQDARAEAQRIRDEACGSAEAVVQTARQQARQQAQEVLDAAASEANEIHNIHQLRLQSLKDEVAQLEARRDALLEYLSRMGSELLRVEKMARTAGPTQDAASGAVDTLPDLDPIETPELQLDLSPETVSRTAAEILQSREAAEEPSPAEEPSETPPQPEELPEYLSHPEPVSVPGEVPGAPVGAIFSSPIVNPTPEPLPVAKPSAGPRLPVMPDLEADEAGEDAGGLPDVEPEDYARALARRRKAVRAVRALQKIQRRGQ